MTVKRGLIIGGIIAICTEFAVLTTAWVITHLAP